MLLSSQDDLEFVGEGGDGSEALAMVKATTPDVVLMDIRMPVMDGVAATAQLMAELPEPPRIIVLTTFDLDEAAARALRAGASGFLLKDAEPEFLLAAIRTVHAGTAVLAPSATRELLEQFSGRTVGDEAALLEDLTDREREIFRLAARGKSNAEIAAGEFVSEATVKTHISRILAKLGLRDRVQLVVFAHERGLV
jgi:DNA-binding NarL/FixJ family response regulator